MLKLAVRSSDVAIFGGRDDIPFPEMKSDLVETIRAELRARLELMAKAARAAHEAATDPGSKAESKYDTRSLEESYLATGQARQFKELAQTLAVFENVTMRDFSKDEEIDAGALVKTKRQGGRDISYFLMAPTSGGLEIIHKKKQITLLSPDSPLYQKLMGLRVGDSLESPPLVVSAVS